MLNDRKLENDQIDVLGQQPFLYKLYTQLCLVFPVTDPSCHDTIVTTLKSGLARLTEDFPWLAGDVINEGASEGVTGTFRIVPSETIPLVIQDLRHDASAPTIEDLRLANFPCSMLDENLVAPCLTLNVPGNTVGLAATAAPVFAVQVNFITGGLILTIVAQHNVMDMTGQGQIVEWLSKACKNQPLTADEVFIGNTDRSKTVELLDESYKPGPELALQMVKPTPKSTTDNTAPPKSTWAYVAFPERSLQALKSLATDTKTLPSGFISTDDAVSSFIWKCISRARIPRLQADTKSLFARAVDVRQRMGVPSTYPGFLQSMTYNTDTLQGLAEAPLGAIASQLRRQLDPAVSDLEYSTRALVTLLSRTPDKSKASVTASVNIPSDIMLSSWAKINTYELDFNLGLGTPEAVRRPMFVPFESLLYLMPRSPQGEMAVQICLRDEDWERLKEDTEFTAYAQYIG